MSLTEAFERYRDDVIVFGNQSPKTEESHYLALKSLLSFVGRDIPVEELTFDTVRRWKEHVSKGRSPKTVRGYIIKLRVVLAHLRKLGVECLDPELIPPPKAPNTVPQFISPEEVALLIKHCRRVRSKAIIALLYASGIRNSELISLNRGDIKEDSFTVVGKGGRARLCFLDKRAAMYISQYLKIRKDNHPALFLSTQRVGRMTPTNVQCVLKCARQNAKINTHVTPHTLRHSFATNLLRSNMNIRYVQELLGHASLETTQMYTHVVNHDLKEQYKLHHTV